MKTSVGFLAAFASGVTAVGTAGRSFAVLRFFGDGALVETRADPIVQPNVASSHVHTVMGASNFGFNSTGDSLFESECSNALIEGDFSAYWMPKLYFHDKDKGTFEPVELFYMNVYYFFEGTNDKIKAFPKGLQMVSGDAMTRTCPTSGKQITDPDDGTIQPAQITCPRSNFNPPSYPVDSDGSKAGIVDPNNKGSGVGFPFAECDGYASPLRADLHFPSCYKPSVGLTNYKENMAWPTHTGNGMQDCAEGEIHVPHLFYEMYWNTPKFIDRWTPNQGYQPFVFSNGDVTGCSLHGDFLAAWDENTLQHIIDTCDAGDSGMDNCPGVTVRDKKKECHIAPLVNEAVTGVLSKLPGDNPLAGWSYGTGTGGGSSSGGSSGSSSSAAAPAQSSTTPGGVKVDPPTTSKAAPVSTPPAETESESSTEASAAPTTTAVEEPEPTSTKAPVESPKPTSAPAVVNNAGNGVHVSTVWDTIYTTVTTTVYEDDLPEATQAPSAANASLPDVAGWKYAGCFKDTRTRVIQGERLPNLGAMSNEKCVSYCQSKGFSVAGTEYGGQCFCGNELVGSEQLAESLCDAACEGDSVDTCGGDWSLTLYSSTGSAPLAKRHEHAYNHFLNHRRSAHRRR